MIKIDRRLGIVIVILIILIVGYKLKGYLSSRKSKKGGKKLKTNSKKIGKSSKSGKNNKSKEPTQRKSKDSSSESESDSDDEVDVKHDAKTLYALIHSDMCRGMSLDEFQKRTSGNDSINDSIFYIELKQIYNTCVEEGKNPESTIKISDYINVLGKK